MARFEPLDAARMTDEQRQAVADLESGPRGKLNPHGPNALLLRSPDLMSRTQQVGAYLRYGSALPRRLREFAILVTARQWGAQVEWLEHHKLALEAGIDPAVTEALWLGTRPAAMRDDEAAVHDFLVELHRTHSVGDAAFAAVADRFGERGVIDLIGLTGYYSMLAMVLNVAQQPLPGGVPPPLPPLSSQGQ